jgi:hypothetical protein
MSKASSSFGFEVPRILSRCQRGNISLESIIKFTILYRNHDGNQNVFSFRPCVLIRPCLKPAVVMQVEDFIQLCSAQVARDLVTTKSIASTVLP